jgi:hypothetical protein
MDELVFSDRQWARRLRFFTPGMSERVWRSLTVTLPGSKSHAFWALLLFVAVQFADGAQTYMGMMRFGPGIEANPILAFLAGSFGASVALASAKTVAIVGGAVLHVLSQHLILAALTVACVFGAIVPWAMVLSY